MRNGVRRPDDRRVIKPEPHAAHSKGDVTDEELHATQRGRFRSGRGCRRRRDRRDRGRTGTRCAGPRRPDEPATRPRSEKFKHPKLKHGVLTVTGTHADDKIALRLQAGHPDKLEVDVGDDGSADFRFDREHIADDRGGRRVGRRLRAHRREQRRLHRHASRRRSTVETETTRSPAARATRRCSAATATTRSTATAATTSPSSVRATTRSSGTRATAATPSRARTAPTRCSSTAPTPTRGSRCRRTARACSSSAAPPTSRWTRTGSRRSTSTPSAERTSSPSTTSPEPTSPP